MSTTNRAAPPNSSAATAAAAPAAFVRRMVVNLLLWIRMLGRAPRSRPPRVRAGAWLFAGVAVAAIAASMFLIDYTASEWARNLPQWVMEPADTITNFGLSGRFLYPLGLFVLLLAELMSPKLPAMTRGVLGVLAARAGFLFLAIGAPSLFDTIVKRMIGRARPYVGSHDDPFSYRPFIWLPEYASMPSGHATTAAAAAIAIGAIWPRLRAVVWLYALIIMLTRVVMNVHHPSDVLAGGLVGVVGALMVRRFFAARGLVFAAGDLRAFPGPSWQRIAAAARQVAGLPAPAAR